MNFRQALLQVSKDMYDSGEVTSGQLMVIRLQSLRSRVLREWEQELCDHCVRIGALPFGSSGASIDWSLLFAQIIEFIKMLLELLS